MPTRKKYDLGEIKKRVKTDSTLKKLFDAFVGLVVKKLLVKVIYRVNNFIGYLYNTDRTNTGPTLIRDITKKRLYEIKNIFKRINKKIDKI
jgi:hypothetical protein